MFRAICSANYTMPAYFSKVCGASLCKTWWSSISAMHGPILPRHEPAVCPPYTSPILSP